MKMRLKEKKIHMGENGLEDDKNTCGITELGIDLDDDDENCCVYKSSENDEREKDLMAK